MGSHRMVHFFACWISFVRYMSWALDGSSDWRMRYDVDMPHCYRNAREPMDMYVYREDSLVAWRSQPCEEDQVDTVGQVLSLPFSHEIRQDTRCIPQQKLGL